MNEIELKDKLLKNKKIILELKEKQLNKCIFNKISFEFFKYLIKYTTWISLFIIIIVFFSRLLINFSNDIYFFSLGNILIASVLTLFSLIISYYINIYKKKKTIFNISINYGKLKKYIYFYVFIFIIFLTLSGIPNFYNNIFRFLGCYTYMYLPIITILLFFQLIFYIQYLNKKRNIIKKYNNKINDIDNIIKK